MLTGVTTIKADCHLMNVLIVNDDANVTILLSINQRVTSL